MNIKNFLLELFFPICCLACEKESKEKSYLCETCFKQLKFCQRNYDLKLSYVDEVFIVGDYNDPILAKLLKLYKFNSINEIAKILSRFLNLFWQGRAVFLKEEFIVVPIPLSRRRLNERGFNQAELIAQNFASDFGYLLGLSLSKIKRTKKQSDLEEKYRNKNIEGAFTWTGTSLINKSVIILDDIITTGATVNEAGRILKMAGAKRVVALALAKG